MSKKSNHELGIELSVGILVTVLFMGLFFFTIIISGKDLLRKDVFPIEVVVPDAMGLRRNDPVIAKGTTVGAVTDVFYATDGVHVAAKLQAPVIFHEGYSITVKSTSILGGRQLVLHEGDTTRPVVEDVLHLIGEEPSDLMSNLDEVSGNIKNGQGTLGKLLSTNDEIYVSLYSAITNINNTFSNLNVVAERLERGEGTLGKLLSTNDEVYVGLYSAITNIDATFSNANLIAERLERGEGTLGKLLSTNDEVYVSLYSAVTNIDLTFSNANKIAERLERGEGTLGKLMSADSEMYDNINGAVSDVRELLDDMREANTLSTFTSVLLGGF